MPTASSSYEGIVPLPPSVVSIHNAIFQQSEEQGESVTVPTNYTLYTSADAPDDNNGRNGDWYFFADTNGVKIYQKVVNSWVLVLDLTGGPDGPQGDAGPAGPAGADATGTVESVSVVTANGFSATITDPTTTPAITIIAGAIAPTSVNGVVLSGSSTPTLAVTGTAAVSGTNTGDQASGVNSGTATRLAYYASTGTQVSELTSRFTFSATGSTTVNADGSDQPVLIKPSGAGYLHVGAGAYAIGAYTVYNSFQIPHAKADTTWRNALFVGGNDGANPFGLNVAILGNATDANRIVALSATEIGSNVGKIRFLAEATEWMASDDINQIAARLTLTTTNTTLESVITNANFVLKGNGTGGVWANPSATGYFHVGATAYATVAYSIDNSFQYNLAKETETPRNALFIGSNDGSNPFGLLFNITGHGTDESRIIKLQAGEVGSNSAGIIQLNGTKVELYGTSSTLVATASSALFAVVGAVTATTSITTGAPAGGTAAPFKIGVVSTVTALAPDRTIEIDISGTRYFLHAKTTND